MPIVAVPSIVRAQIPNPFKIPDTSQLLTGPPEDVFNQPASSNGKPFNPNHNWEERRVAASLLAKPQLSATRSRIPPRDFSRPKWYRILQLLDKRSLETETATSY